jgi:HemY protein
MWRVLVFLGLLLLAAFGLSWLADRPGDVVVNWGGYRIQTSLMVALLGIAALAFLIMAVWTLYRAVGNAPDLLSRAFRARRRSKGYSAVSRGLVAVGSGDVRGARRAAADAERLIGDEPLALLLTAQAAQLSGDRTGAEAAFSKMAKVADTRVLGLRGLFVEARRRGDEDAAFRHAEEAVRLQASVPWANEALIGFQCRAQDWTGAIATLERAGNLGLVDKPALKRQKAALLAARALSLESADPQGAREAALAALKLNPGLVPAAALVGRLLGQAGDIRKASKLLEAAWRESPHPDIAAAYAGLRPGDSAHDRLSRVEHLTGASPHGEEARVAFAKAALAAREFARARAALEPLTHERPSARICLAMAAIEEAEHGATGAVREWLARASRAPRDPAWIADGVISDRWAPVSPVSGRIDAFVWSRPPELLAAPGPDLAMDDVHGDIDEAGVRALAPVSAPAPAQTIEAPPPAPPAGEVAQIPAPAPVEILAAEPPAKVAPPAAATEAKPEAADATPPEAPAQGEPDKVVFPLGHAPDDPGIEAAKETAPTRSRFRLFG